MTPCRGLRGHHWVGHSCLRSSWAWDLGITVACGPQPPPLAAYYSARVELACDPLRAFSQLVQWPNL